MTIFVISCLIVILNCCPSLAIEDEPVFLKLKYDKEMLETMVRMEARMAQWDKERKTFEETVTAILAHRREEMQESFAEQNEKIERMFENYNNIRDELTNKTAHLEELAVCVNLPAIPNGGATLDATGKMSYLDTATVYCDTGYQTDKTSIKCQADTEWEPTSCEKKVCGSVYNVLNGAASLNVTDAISYLDTATITCDTGYQTDKTSIMCQESGEWDLSQCEKKVCGSVYNVPNGAATLDVTDAMSYLDTATITCNTGYQTDKTNIMCQASGEWEQSTCEKKVSGFSDCKDIADNIPTASTGIYQVVLWNSSTPLSVYCDMDMDGGGWTVFQNRHNGSVDFYRTFVQYENGFGYINGEFWLGLKYLQEMVALGTSELRIDVSANDSTTGYTLFQDFSISAPTTYALHISLGTGTIGDSTRDGLSFNNNGKFSTYDHDQDTSTTHCALINEGAWWFKSCMYVHLNGKYCPPGTTSCGYHGMIYYKFKYLESLVTSRMMFRRV